MSKHKVITGSVKEPSIPKPMFVGYTQKYNKIKVLMFNIHNDDVKFYNLTQARKNNFAINLNPKYRIKDYDCHDKLISIYANKKSAYEQKNEAN